VAPGWLVGWCLTGFSAHVLPGNYSYNIPTQDRWLNQGWNPGPSNVQTTHSAIGLQMPTRNTKPCH